MKYAPLLVLCIAGCAGPVDTLAPSANTVTPDMPASAAVEPQAEDADMPKQDDATDKVVRTDEEWRQLLTPEQYYVLREKGTERPFVNKFDHHFAAGTYSCAACGQDLFESETKFNSGCGWPAFYAAKAGDRVKLTRDFSLGMLRTEVTCARCDSHLGHIFNDSPQTPTGQRYCINSVSLKFTPAPKAESANPPAIE